jgi:hypothetical protein
MRSAAKQSSGRCWREDLHAEEIEIRRTLAETEGGTESPTCTTPGGMREATCGGDKEGFGDDMRLQDSVEASRADAGEAEIEVQ